MTESYCVRVCKDDLVFSAAHFITYGSGICERLHGHNYRVAAEVCGPLDENHYVVDFILLRDVVKAVIDELDHRVLLPTGHQSIRVDTDRDQVQAAFEDRRWAFPRTDCALLPIPNTTSELLARYIGRRVLANLAAQMGARPERIRIEVDDCFGQTARVELDGKQD